MSRSVSIMRILVFFPLLIPAIQACRSNQSTPPAASAASSGSTSPGGTITLSSGALQGGKILKEFTCDGEDKSPALTWTAAPGGTRSFVLTVTDPDVHGGPFTHWVLYNLPPNISGLPTGVPKQDQLEDGSRQGRNDFGKVGYGGSCPPHGSTHRYFFDLFAIDTTLNLPAGATRAQVEDAMNTHVLSRGKLVARYGR
jgi:hypothetical protein